MQQNKSYSGALSHVSLFAKSLPNSKRLYVMLVLLGIVSGLLTSYVAHLAHPLYGIEYAAVSGAIGGILAIIIPTTITIILFKALRSYIRFKYIIFVSFLAELTYGIFLIFSGAVYYISHSYALALAVIIVGDASIFAWWVFVNKLMMNRSKNASMFALLQPTINLVFFLPASAIFFGVTVPLGILLVKLYAAIFVFLLVSYTIIYFVDSPIKRSLGFSGIDTFSQMMQNWLFNINVSIPDRKTKKQFGEKIDIDLSTVTVVGKSGKQISSIIVPNIHFGPVGTLGSSNFPYLIERHVIQAYKSQAVVLHSAINEDYNAVSSDQFAQLKRAIDEMLKNPKPMKAGTGHKYAYYYGESNGARIRLIKFGDSAIATLSRAPRVTEDITPEASVLIKNALSQIAKNVIIVDAHNSRYESAPKVELSAVKFDSAVMKDYMDAIKNISVISESDKIRVGKSSSNLFDAFGRPADMAPGNVNVLVYDIGGKMFGMIEFNANNSNPQFRTKLLSYLNSKFNADFELYTTDTHYVNSLRHTASNVLGTTTTLKQTEKKLEEMVKSAISDMSDASLIFQFSKVKNFSVWGINQREKMLAALDSMIATDKVLVPTIIAVGFLIAAWIITLI